MDDESSSGRTTPAQNDHSGPTQLTLLIGRAWHQIGGSRTLAAASDVTRRDDHFLV